MLFPFGLAAEEIHGAKSSYAIYGVCQAFLKRWGLNVRGGIIGNKKVEPTE
jgi:hypothetical protein